MANAGNAKSIELVNLARSTEETLDHGNSRAAVKAGVSMGEELRRD